MRPSPGPADDLTPRHPRQQPDVEAALAEACRQAGLNPRHARLIRHFSNAVYLVDGVVARVSYGPDGVSRAERGLAAAHWLAGQGFPVAAPVDIAASGEPSPVLVMNDTAPPMAVTFWTYHPQPDDLAPDFHALGHLALLLHRVPAPPPIELPAYEPLASLQHALAAPSAALALDPDSLEWLAARAAALAAAVATVPSALGVGLIHADMWSGNLLHAPGQGHRGWLLGDWDSVCIGPREVDLAPTAVAKRFGGDERSAAQVASGYGVDVRDWPGYPLLRAVRELSTLSSLIKLAARHPDSARELELRLNSLRRGDDALWNRQ
ncbi:phosphotransferase [Catellatospora sp. NPDC049133]|uniref:phosphotransferase n=1 Tax=Catellatospora sp. NPDC049133 TaxID=3155499 RepID=UPI0033C84192